MHHKIRITWIILLLTAFVLANTLEDDISYFILYGSTFLFTLYQLVHQSKWYFLGLFILLMQFSDMMNTYLHLEVDLWFLSLFLLCIAIFTIMLIITLVRHVKNKKYHIISTLIGNSGIVFFILFIANSYNVGWSSVEEGYIVANSNLIFLSFLTYMIMYFQSNYVNRLFEQTK